MADYPAYQKNSQVATQPATVDGPAFVAPDGTKTAQELFIEQQWRDVEKSNLGARHPLALNRDSAYVTSDPYDVP